MKGTFITQKNIQKIKKLQRKNAEVFTLLYKKEELYEFINNNKFISKVKVKLGA